MALIIVTDDKGVKIFRKDKQTSKGTTFPTYFLAISVKNDKGGYDNSYFDVKFKKGIEVGNKAVIKIKKSWLTFDEYQGKKYNKLFISDFEIIEVGETPNVSAPSTDMGFMSIPDGVDSSLPFV